MLSSRYAAATCVALLLALVPTIIHSYVGVVVTDGRATASIPTTLMSYTSFPTKHPVDWGESHFDSHDWFDRTYTLGGDTVVLTVVRSYDLKALYHHPELAVAYHSAKFDRSEMGTLPGHPDIPIHVLSNDGATPIGLYALHYDGRFIDDPIRFQLRTAGELLFTGRKPMTLFFVRDDAGPAGVAPLKLPAAQLLREAIEQFLRSGPSAQ
jgi:hypothetical protein